MISVLYAERLAGRDGIRDFSEALAAALSELPGVDAQLVLWRRSDGWPEALAASTSIVLQYNPYSYGRGGFAPALLAGVRRRHSDCELFVLVHEPYTPISDVPSAIMGTWQRIQLRLLLGMADAVGITAEQFQRYLPVGERARAVHVPAGSPLPDGRDRRSATRASLGVSDDDLVVALYGSRHPSRLIELGVAAIGGLANAGADPVVLNLGFAAPPIASSAVPARVVQPGPLPPMALAGHLAAADIALLPFVDGASTRRTTLISALQQQTCVLSTHGHLTDGELADGRAPILTPAGDPDAFVEAAVALASDPVRRARIAGQGRELFEARYGWPVIAQRVHSGLSSARAA